MSMIFFLSLCNEAIFLSVSLRICECKSNKLFCNDQMFFKKILKFFFLTLNPFQTLNLNSCAPLKLGLQIYNCFLFLQIFQLNIF